MPTKFTMCLVCAICTYAASAAVPSVSDLDWLAGCWAGDGSEAGSGENWMTPAGGMMLGVGRTVRAGKAVAFEFMRIVESEDGSLRFFAAPAGRDATPFELVELGDRQVVFENPEHDFPQRIIYRLISNTRLLGRIEGTTNGDITAADFPMTRAECT
jgi:hypothetical protein